VWKYWTICKGANYNIMTVLQCKTLKGWEDWVQSNWYAFKSVKSRWPRIIWINIVYKELRCLYFNNDYKMEMGYWHQTAEEKGTLTFSVEGHKEGINHVSDIYWLESGKALSCKNFCFKNIPKNTVTCKRNWHDTAHSTTWATPPVYFKKNEGKPVKL